MKSQEKLPHCSSSNGYESTEDKIYWRLAGYLVMERDGERDTFYQIWEVSLIASFILSASLS
jgi:hypothetical protein